MKYQPSACEMRFKMSAFIPQSLYICIVDAVYTFYSWERERERERERETKWTSKINFTNYMYICFNQILQSYRVFVIIHLADKEAIKDCLRKKIRK